MARILLLLATVFTASQCLKYSSKYNRKDFEKFTSVPSDNESDRFHDSDSFKTHFKPAVLKKDEKLNNPYSDVKRVWPIRVFDCVTARGVADCLKIFLVRRMERVKGVIDQTESHSNVTVYFDDLVSEIEKDFKWENYKRHNERDLDELIFKNFKGLLKGKEVKVALHSGIDLDFFTSENGSITLNIKKDPELQLPRGMKFPKNAFYRIVPMLLIPPLIMSAILPFVLPAMKMMIVGAGMLNQMALMGAIFTLMRNNAFQDTSYSKKVIYVNKGYKNEKKSPSKLHHENFHHSIPELSHASPALGPAHHYKIIPHVGDSHYDEEMYDGGDDFSEKSKPENQYPETYHAPNNEHFLNPQYGQNNKYPVFQKKNDRRRGANNHEIRKYSAQHVQGI